MGKQQPKRIRPPKKPDYIPQTLVCGYKVNREWEPGQELECCFNACPDEEKRGSVEAVGVCYDSKKSKDAKVVGKR